MLTTPSRDNTDPHRIARAAVLNGVPIPATTVARLEAQGVNVGDLENRIRQSLEYKL